MQKGMAGVICLIFALAGHAQISNCLSHWTWRNPLTRGDYLTDITFGNGTYVAVGLNGGILISTNGFDWSVQSKVNFVLEAVTFANGKFVAAGGAGSGAIAVSTNGIDWQSTIFPAVQSSFHELAYGNGKFIAVAGATTGSTLAISADAQSWFLIPFTNTTWLSQIAFGNGRFVAVSGSGAALTSLDGVQWQAGTTGSSNYSIYTISFINGRFHATGAGEPISSPNGLDWSPDSSLPPAQIIQAGSGYLSPVTNTVLVSADLETWVTNTLSMSDSLFRIASDGTGGVAIGGNSSIVASSNLLDWQIVNTTDFAYNYSLVYGAGQFVAFRNNGSVLTSPDGFTWETSTNVGSATYLMGAVFAENRFLAVGGGGRGVGWNFARILSSSNGKAWTELFQTNFAGLRSVAYGAGRFVAVGGSHFPIAATSTDRTNWFYARLHNWDGPLTYGFPSNDDGAFYDVAYGGGVFVAVGAKEYQSVLYGLTAHSTNGTNWSGNWNYGARYLMSVAYGNGIFVAAEYNGYIQVSTNGVTWNRVLPTGVRSLAKIHFARGVFVAVGPYPNYGGGAYAAISTNGSNWLSYPLPLGAAMTDITAGPNSFLVSGEHAVILESAPFQQPTIDFQRNSASTWMLSVEMEPHFPHLLEWSGNLRNWQSSARIASTNGSYTEIQTFSDVPARFYRVRSF